jgi:hypothetical protein
LMHKTPDILQISWGIALILIMLTIAKKQKR